jgi:hypothetical protein
LSVTCSIPHAFRIVMRLSRRESHFGRN